MRARIFFEGSRERFDLGAGGGLALLPGRLYALGWRIPRFPGGRPRRIQRQFRVDGRSLLGGLYGVELGAEADGLLAVGGDLALKTAAQRFLPVESIGGFGGLALGGGQRGLCLSGFGRQGAEGKGEPYTLQIDAFAALRGFQCSLASVL